MQYGYNLANFSANHQYTKFTVPDGYKPKMQQTTNGIIVSGTWTLVGSCALTIDTNGVVSLVSTTTQSGTYTFMAQLVYICV